MSQEIILYIEGPNLCGVILVRRRLSNCGIKLMLLSTINNSCIKIKIIDQKLN